jgi:hypothetical protein
MAGRWHSCHSRPRCLPLSGSAVCGVVWGRGWGLLLVCCWCAAGVLEAAWLAQHALLRCTCAAAVHLRKRLRWESAVLALGAGVRACMHAAARCQWRAVRMHSSAVQLGASAAAVIALG